MDKSNPGLDMKHGFIHHIRRNQYKRDAFDREVKAGTGVRKPKLDSAKYPDQQVYHPKGRGSSEVKGDSKKSTREGRVLFVLEYTDNSGWVHKVNVHRDDKPKVVAKRLSLAAKVPAELLDALEWKIEQDIIKRDV